MYSMKYEYLLLYGLDSTRLIFKKIMSVTTFHKYEKCNIKVNKKHMKIT